MHKPIYKYIYIFFCHHEISRLCLISNCIWGQISLMLFFLFNIQKLGHEFGHSVPRAENYQGLWGATVFNSELMKTGKH